jgi:putative oxidoreductase
MFQKNKQGIMTKQKLILALNCCTFLLVLLWIYTAISKLSNLSEFERQLSKQNFNHPLQITLRWLIPFSEILAVLLLIFSKTRAMGMLLSLLLMVAFTGYIGLALLGLYEKRPCSCGGVISIMTWNQHFLFNLFFLTIAFIGIWCERKLNYIPHHK